MCGSAPIDVDHLTGDVGRIKKQEFYGTGDVARVPHAFQKRVLDDGVALAYRDGQVFVKRRVRLGFRLIGAFLLLGLIGAFALFLQLFDTF